MFADSNRKAIKTLIQAAIILVVAAICYYIGMYREESVPHVALSEAGRGWLIHYSDWKELSAGKTYSVQRVSDPPLNGEDSLRFELRAGETWTNRVHPTFRSEIETNDAAPIGAVRWYRLALMLAKDFPIEENRLVLFQWHGADKKYLGEVARSPTLSFRYSGGALKITLYHSSERVVRDAETVPKETLLRSKDFSLGAWNDFVVQAKWDYTNAGYVNIWWNGKRVVSYRGPVGYNDNVGPYVQFGLYRDDSKKTYVSYINQVRAGDSAASVGFVVP